MTTIIDLSKIKNSKELHEMFKSKLDFPEFYGMNWDAFWDAITGLVELPDNLVIYGWDNVVKILPDDAKIIKQLFDKFNKEYPMFKCIVEYK